MAKNDPEKDIISDRMAGAIKIQIHQSLREILVPLFSDIWRNDKTVYTFTGKQAGTRDGAIPEDGERFLSPREMIREFAQKYGFWRDMQQYLGRDVQIERKED